MRLPGLLKYRKKVSLQDLAGIRVFVEQNALSCGLRREAVDDIVLAIDEAVTNILVHGYAGETGIIEIEIISQGSEVSFFLRDQARPFDPTQVSKPDLSLTLDQRPFGGMGTFFINQLVDRLEYRQIPEGGNELKLIKASQSQ